MSDVLKLTAPRFTTGLSVIANVDTSRYHMKTDSNVVSVYNYLHKKISHIRHEGKVLYYDIY